MVNFSSAVTTEGKNVDGQIEYIPSDVPGNEKQGSIVIKKVPDYTLAIVLGVFLGVSVIINVILIIMLMYKKNKDIVVPTDSRDRTDFDIDILE